MNLYLIHCGFYDSQIGDGLYEIHTNLFVAAESFADAKRLAKAKPVYKRRKMHVDGMQEISAVDGFRIELAPDELLAGASLFTTSRYAARPPEAATPGHGEKK